MKHTKETDQGRLVIWKFRAKSTTCDLKSLFSPCLLPVFYKVSTSGENRVSRSLTGGEKIIQYDFVSGEKQLWWHSVLNNCSVFFSGLLVEMHCGKMRAG